MPTAERRRLRSALRALPHLTLRDLRGHDLLLLAAGVTFYAALAVVPVVFVATRLATLLVGRDEVRALAEGVGRALPGAIGADQVALALLGQGTDLGLLPLALCVLPASLYGEGLRRAYAVLGSPDADDRLTGWRGRLAALPVLAAAPALLLAVLAVTPWLADLFSRGAGGVALGVYVALNVDWLVLSLPLAWSFRVVAPDRLGWRVALAGGLVTGAFVAGFLQGFVLFTSLPLDLGAPFGGLVALGAVCAVLLWLWVLHLVVLVGYAATRRLALLLGEGDGADTKDEDADEDRAAGVAGGATAGAQTPVVERG